MNDPLLEGAMAPPSKARDDRIPSGSGTAPWFPGGGEMGERIRVQDWEATPLGPFQSWPQGLRTLVDLMLGSRQPVYVAWGASLTLLYNDSFAPILGTNHPAALGRPHREVWPEMGDPNHSFGSSLAADKRQPGWSMGGFTFSRTPIRDEAGKVAGFYCAGIEMTGDVRTQAVPGAPGELSRHVDGERYHALFEALDQGFCIVELIFDAKNYPIDYIFIETNPTFEAQTGLHDAAGRSMRSLRPEHEEHWFEIYGRIALTGEPERFEHEAAFLSRWYDVFAYRIGDPQRRRVAILFDDITERKKAEEARRESEERLRQVQEAARIGSFDFDRMTGKAIASPEYVELYGLPEDQSASFSYNEWIGLVHPDDRPWIEAETRAAVADPARLQLDYEFRIFRADTGEMRWITARTKLIRDANGRFVRSLGAQWDITAEKDAEAALRESEARYRSFITRSSEGIWLLEFDPPLDTSLPVEHQVHLAYRNGRFVDCNDAMARMYGLARAEDLIGKTLDFPLPSSDPEARAYLADIIRSGYSITGVESVEQDAAGDRKHFDNSMIPIIENGQLKRLWGIQRDITDPKKAEEQRTLLINELNHRVKNTLATVQSIASQTLRNAETAMEAKETLEGRLIALARAHDVLTRESWEGAELKDIVTQALAPYAILGSDRLTISGPEVRLLPRVALALSMALQELTTNAVKYGALSNATGKVDIVWKFEPAEPGNRLHLRWQESRGPHVPAQTRQGFGSRLIERSLARELNGEVQIEFRPAGIVCTVDAPLS